MLLTGAYCVVEHFVDLQSMSVLLFLMLCFIEE